MHIDNFSAAWKGYIRATRCGLPLKAETIAEAVQKLAHNYFRLGVGSAYLAHMGATLLRSEEIWQWTLRSRLGRVAINDITLMRRQKGSHPRL